MILETKTRIAEEHAEVFVPTEVLIDLTEVSVLHPDPEGGTMLFIKGDDWLWVEKDYNEIYPRWKLAKEQQYAMNQLPRIGLS